MKSLSAAGRLFDSNSVLDYCDAILYAFRSGKLRETLYFFALEAYYWWCHIYGSRSKLIEFKPTPFWRYSSRSPLDLADLAATLRLCNFSVVESVVKWGVITESSNGTVFGAAYDRPHVLQRSDNLWSTPVDLFEFGKPIVSVFVSRSNLLFVAIQGAVYLSTDGGRQFGTVLQLSDDDSFVWHNHGIDETSEGLVIGEYGIIVDSHRSRSFWKPVAYLYLTKDDGRTWRRVDHLTRSAVKHVHLVKYSRRLNRLLVTDGDKRKRSYWIGTIDRMEAVNFKEGRFDSFCWGGGHTAFAETPDATFMGTDHHGGTNSIICLRSSLDSSAKMLPSPYRRSPVLNMHCVPCGARSFTFASLQSSLRVQWKSAIIYSNDDGDSWNRLLEYDGRWADFSIVNAQQGVSHSLVVYFSNRKSREERTMIISVL